jgi:peptide/nickel transport system permease protein
MPPDTSLADTGAQPGQELARPIRVDGAPLADEAEFGQVRRRRWGLYVAIAWFALVVLASLFHSLLPVERYDQIVATPRKTPCLCLHEPLGTDAIGRSVTSRLIVGARQSLAVGGLSVGIAFVAGGLIGVVAGYRKGWTDRLIGLFVNAGLAFPPLVLLLAFAAMLEPSLSSIVIALACLFSFQFQRLARANTLSLANREFVVAARTSGARHRRVLVREIVPNVAIPLISYAFVIMATAMIAEGSLSFLGFGIPPPAPSWGGMINAGRPYLSTTPSLVFVPALTLLLTVLSLNTIGDAARRRFEGREMKLA